MKQMTEAQICARLRELAESRRFHHVRKSREEKREVGYESDMVVRGGHKLTGSYKTARQVMDSYEEADWELESGRRMFEAGKGTRFTKRVSVNKGAHYTKGGSVTSTNRPTAQGEVCSIGRVITVRRFSGSRLTCVCKSKKY